METSSRTEIDHLKAEIAQNERHLLQLEKEVADIHAELMTFKKHYDSVVGALVERLETVKRAITDLEQQIMQRQFSQPPVWTPPEGYISVEEQYRRVWESVGASAANEPPLFEMPPDPKPASDIKKLYRQLAQRYHPDHTSDDDERKYRTDVMAQINAAYAEQDYEALQALADENTSSTPQEPLHVLHLRRLRQLQSQLRQRIFDLKQEKHSLLTCDLMRLKMEVSLAQAGGRDLLAEITADLDQTYRRLLRRLYDLRHLVV